MRVNNGYVIKDSIHIGDIEYVLGENEGEPNLFVTWQYANKADYYWGHYFNDRTAAVRDLLQRVQKALPQDKETPCTRPYFFCMTVCATRTGTAIGRRCGVVMADSRESAEKTAWEQFGGDNACKLWVQRIPEDGYGYTVYKSEIL